MTCACQHLSTDEQDTMLTSRRY